MAHFQEHGAGSLVCRHRVVEVLSWQFVAAEKVAALAEKVVRAIASYLLDALQVANDQPLHFPIPTNHQGLHPYQHLSIATHHGVRIVRRSWIWLFVHTHIEFWLSSGRSSWCSVCVTRPC